MDVIIHKLTWLVKVPDDETGRKIQTVLAELTASTSFKEQLESELHSFFGEDQHLSIDRLELNITNLTEQNFQNRLKEELISQLKSQLREKKQTGTLAVMSETENNLTTFLQFLATGNIPQALSAPLRSHTDLADWLAAQFSGNTELAGQIWKRVMQNQDILAGLANLPVDVYGKQLRQSLNKSSRVISWFTQAENAINAQPEARQIRLLLWQYLLDQSANREELLAGASKVLSEAMVTASNRQVAAIQKAIAQIQPHTGKTSPTTVKAVLDNLKIPESTSKRSEHKPTPGKLLVKNAGLVIIAPFLPALFQALELADEKTINNFGKTLAVLQEIEWGKLGKHGADLALPKILCGLPLNQSIQPDTRITPKEKRETEAMLQEVISHWKALKNTSPDGLRTNYFWREGLLAERDSGYVLQVESKAQDVLLAHLPWGIGTIKLPWMKYPLHVEWL